MNGKARIDFRDIKAISIVCYDEIGGIEYFVQFADQGTIIMPSTFVNIEIRKGKTLDFTITIPENGKAQNVSIPLDPNGIGLIGLPGGDN